MPEIAEYISAISVCFQLQIFHPNICLNRFKRPSLTLERNSGSVQYATVFVFMNLESMHLRRFVLATGGRGYIHGKHQHSDNS